MASRENTDCYTLRPRTPNDPYSEITDEQIANLKKDANPFFFSQKQEKLSVPPPREGGRYYLDRYCSVTNKALVRKAGADNYGWIDERHTTIIPEEYDANRGMASVKWGANKNGERTRSHFFGEQIDRYTTIDMYRRPATNYAGPVAMKFGRPGQGYYAQRFPDRVTWTGSSVPLNRTQILPSLGKKTMAEYDAIKTGEQLFRSERTKQWPEYSEYTDKFLLNTKTPVVLSGMEARKAFLQQQREEMAQVAQEA